MTLLFTLPAALLSGFPPAGQAAEEPLDYRVELSAAASGFDGRMCWVHAEIDLERQQLQAPGQASRPRVDTSSGPLASRAVGPELPLEENLQGF